jgi:hypothetical protein
MERKCEFRKISVCLSRGGKDVGFGGKFRGSFGGEKMYEKNCGVSRLRGVSNGRGAWDLGQILGFLSWKGL